MKRWGLILGFFSPAEDTMKLKGKVALITGGGRGIGRAIALRFAREGAAVMVTSRTASELAQVVQEIVGAGGEGASVQADAATQAEIEKVVKETRAQLGPIDILVNNAGVYGPVETVEKISPGDFDRVIAVNLRAPFLFIQLVLPEMKKRKAGVIVNISSVSGKHAFTLNAAYGASKAGLLALTRTVAAEAAADGVRVNAICPGVVEETRMYYELGEELTAKLGITSQELDRATRETILLRRPQLPDEVAAAALFLASEDSSAVTGQAINVDGGFVFY
jgi:NAD(P)-dependent dehydrogenase (short-subunit alcohol dehydrogenase family)